MGESDDSWSMPALIWYGVDRNPSIVVFVCLLLRKLGFQVTVFSSTLLFRRSWSKRVCVMLSKAAETSNNRRLTT